MWNFTNCQSDPYSSYTPDLLSAKEKEILQLAANGISNEDIAKKYDLSETELKSLYSEILKKIQAC